MVKFPHVIPSLIRKSMQTTCRATCRLVLRRSLKTARCFSSIGNLTEEERYLFDLQGYLVLRQAISGDEIAQMNRAIDKHQDQFVERQQTIRNAKVKTFKGEAESYAGRYEHGTMQASVI